MDYCKKDIVIALKNAGIKKDDTVFIHSNIGFFGRANQVNNSEELCRIFLEAFYQVIGKEGTIVVPTFSYSFCHDEIFNVMETKSACGMFSEYIRKNKFAIRSRDPNFSVSAIGKLAIEYTKDVPHESFGNFSFWERFLKRKGKIVCMNMDCGSTFVHYVENCGQVPYRYNKSFNGIIMDKKGEMKRDYFVHFVYDLKKPETAPFFGNLDRLCRNKNICNMATLGKGLILTMEVELYYNLIMKQLIIQPGFLTIKGELE